MSSNRLELKGLDELRRALRALPEQLRAEASQIVVAKATEAKNEIQAAYVEGPTGNLKKLIGVTTSTSGLTAGALVKSRSPHAHLYEFGTQVRRNNAGANRGAMPPKPTFIPIVQRKRREMVTQLTALLTRQGLQVSGAE